MALGGAGPVAGQTNGIFADFQTSMGAFTCRLDYTNAPRTVANFIGLATGQRAWLDTANGAVRTNGFYHGLLFHRVMAGFMNQSGSRNALGTDGPGYTFPDEFSTLLRHDGPGVLSMANSGADSNGSQFFVTVAATAWLNDVHSVFGRVESGMDVVNAINAVDTGGGETPLTPVVISNVVIRRVGAAAAAFSIATQKLPVVRSLDLGMAAATNTVTLSFPRTLFSQHFLHMTTNLPDAVWSSFNLGYEGAVPTSAPISVDVAGMSRSFFSVAQVQYPYAPVSLRNRLLGLFFDIGALIYVQFNAASGGTYSYGVEYGTIPGYYWEPQIYYGYLWPIQFSGKLGGSTAPSALYLRLMPTSDGGGRFVHYVDDGSGNAVPANTGTYTLGP